MREDFDELRIPSEIVERYPPDRFVLFDLLRSLVPDTLLKEIALADYGQEVQRHLDALKRVRNRQGEDQRLDWYPREVLELVRWGAPKEWPAHDRQLATSFCACALIVMPWAASDEGFLEADSVAALLIAVPELDSDLIVPLIKLLVELLVHSEPWDEDYLYVAFGCVYLLYRVEGADWMRWADWFATTEREALPWHSTMYPQAHSFLEIRSTVSHERFQVLVEELLKVPELAPEFKASMERAALVEDEGLAKVLGKVAIHGVSAIWQMAKSRLQDIFRRR